MKERDQESNAIKALFTVVVTEDDKGLQYLIQKRLERDGFKVRPALSGKEAVKTAGELADALLLLDYRLGDMTGKEVLDLLAERSIKVPFIIMTGHGDERIAVDMMKLGAKDYLVKDDSFLDILPRILENVFKQLSTELKLTQAKKALQESEERFRLLFNGGTDAIFVYEVDAKKRSHFVEVNDIACKRLGYTREELLRLGPEDIEDPEWKEEHPLLTEELTEKKKLLYEMVILTRLGKKIPVEVNAQLIDFGGKPVFLSISRDITERKQLEEQLRQAQKMEAIGKLAGGVAHDFNNLLTTINGYAELLLLKLDEESPFKEGVKKIKRAGERAASLTQQLLTFSRKQVLQPRQLDLNNLVKGLERMLARIVGDNIDLSLELEPELMQIKADHDQIEQILINLSVNAGEAMSENGRLTVKTENSIIDEYFSSLTPDSRPGKFVCLSISDSGTGMDTETIKYIFDPFYSTKKVGTGLGLSVVYGIVKQHNGWINVLSNPGTGTIFRIYFPAFSDKNGNDEVLKELDQLRGEGERILLVDDEEVVRKKTANYLNDYGYQVTEAVNSREARAIFQRQKGNFDLCFSDIILPDKSGVELVEELLSINPTLKVLLTSGYADKISRWSEVKKDSRAFLQKPYSLKDLLSAVKDVIQ